VSDSWNLAERHDKRTNGQHYRIQQTELSLVLCGKLNGEVASILVTSNEIATRMLRGSYEETAAVEFSLILLAYRDPR